MSVAMQRLEVLARHAAIGVRFWDVSGATSLIDGLQVEVFPRANPRAAKLMKANPSGVYVGHAVSGLHDFEYSDVDPPALWGTAEAALRACRIEVRDPVGRFLPIAFDAELPHAGLLSWNAPWFSPPQLIVLPGSSGSPPQLMLERIPLFSAPERPLPDALAVVYAQMREPVTQRSAAWACLGVSIEGQRCGIGLADRQGRVAVMFPYPEPPRRTLASPPEARNDFSWPVELEVFWSLPSPPPAVPEIADLAQVLAQLDTPGTVLDTVSPGTTVRRLEYRMPLTARALGASLQDASWLLVSAA